jgi:quercetin dioxygenase-like cupin family protein
VHAATCVVRPSDTPTSIRSEGIRTKYLVTRELGAQQLLNGITEFDPGASLPFHHHNCEESVVVLEGAAVFETEDKAVTLNALDTTFVPVGTVHRFANAGPGIMRILWIYGSVDATRTFRDSGETVPVASAADRR